MHVRLRGKRNLLAGLSFIAIAAAFLIDGRNYEMGTALRMGPSYFPTLLAIVLLGMGLFVCARSFVISDEPIAVPRIRPLTVVIGGLILFGLSLEKIGLIAATALLVIVASFGSFHFKLREAVINAFMLSILSYVLFIYALGIPFKVWPWQ